MNKSVNPLNRRHNSSLLAGVRLTVFAILAGAILWRLGQIGFSEIVANLPSSPTYYLLFLFIYLALPISELLIYLRFWRSSLKQMFAALVRKRVFNEGFLGYSGEAYWGLWAKENLSLSGRDVFSLIKDNNLISSFASLTVTILMVVFVFSAGVGARSVEIESVRGQIFVCMVIGIVLLSLAYYFRKKVLEISARETIRVVSVHFTRLVFVMILQIIQWSVVIPSVPVHSWVLVMTAYFLATRIPFLPSYDFVLLGLGLSMTGLIGSSNGAVAGLFIAGAALSQAMNLIMLIVTSLFLNSKK